MKRQEVAPRVALDKERDKDTAHDRTRANDELEDSVSTHLNTRLTILNHE